MPTLASTLRSFEIPRHTPEEWAQINAEADRWECEQEEQRMASRISQSGIPEEFLNAKLDHDEVAAWCLNPGYGLLLQGEPGRGKTRLACAALMAAARTRTIKFATMGELFRDCKACWSGQETERNVISRYVNVGWLVLDDFGRDPLREWSAPIFSEIIAARDANRPTIITTNYTGPALFERLSVPGDTERAKSNTSRLGRYKQIVVAGKDRRLS